MSVIDDILDDEKEFKMDFGDKTLMYVIGLGMGLPSVIVLPLFMYSAKIHGIENYYESLYFTFWVIGFTLIILCALDSLIHLWSEKYNKLVIDKENNFIFQSKSGKTEIVKLNKIKSINIMARPTIQVSKMAHYNLLYEELINHSQEYAYYIIHVVTHRQIYKISISSIGGFPTENELPCKIEYGEKQQELIYSNKFLLTAILLIPVFAYIFLIMFHK